eukprot:c23194_g1_i3 orf=150-446(-)
MPFYLFRYVDVASLTSPVPQCCMHLSPRHSTRDSTAIFSLAYLSSPLTAPRTLITTSALPCVTFHTPIPLYLQINLPHCEEKRVAAVLCFSLQNGYTF